MLEQLTPQSFTDLASSPAGPCLSIYMPEGGRTAALRLEQIFAELAARPPDPDASPAQIQLWRGQAAALSEELAHRPNRLAPLAILARPDRFAVYQLAVAVRDLAVLGPHPHLKPLVPLLSMPDGYYLLALGKGGVQLFRGRGSALDPVALPGAPDGLAALLAYDEFESQHQLHSGVPGRGGERGPIFHGQGDAADALKPQLRRYCQQVDSALRRAIPVSRDPLLLCGVAYLLAIYRDVSRYPHIHLAELGGSPERLTPAELGAQAWALLQAQAADVATGARAQFQALAAHEPARVASDIRQALPAAVAGQLSIAYVAIDQEQWGRYDLGTGHIQLHSQREPGDEDLLNLIAIEVVRHGGFAYALPVAELPGGGICAAILRGPRRSRREVPYD